MAGICEAFPLALEFFLHLNELALMQCSKSLILRFQEMEAHVEISPFSQTCEQPSTNYTLCFDLLSKSPVSCRNTETFIEHSSTKLMGLNINMHYRILEIVTYLSLLEHTLPFYSLF